MADDFLDFEQPILIISQQIEAIKNNAARQLNATSKRRISILENKLLDVKKNIYANLSRWQKVQISRHPNRPYTSHYIEHIVKDFTELHGDRVGGDDHAIIGGLGKINKQTVMIIGHQKGINTKMRQYRNFGMAHPEGYRKALRLMKLAEKFELPVITLIDTPGAYPGIEGEKRGQGEAIARNLYEMAGLKTPIITFIIGEGASGGALGLAVSDKVFMLEYTWYSVISPESCSSILWRNWNHKEQAAESLKLTAQDMYKEKLVDGIIKEPMGGAHNDYEQITCRVKKKIIEELKKFHKIDKEEMVYNRIQKFASIGHTSK